MRAVGALCRSLRFSRINSPGILMSDSCFRHFAARSGKEEDANYALPPRRPALPGIFRPVKKRRTPPFIYSVFCRLTLTPACYERRRIVPEGQKSTEFRMGGLSLTLVLKMREIRWRFAVLGSAGRCACLDCPHNAFRLGIS